MTAIILTFWKPIAAILAALLGALGLYAKGRADAKGKAAAKDAAAFQKTMERVADAPVISDAADARRLMRDRASN